LPPNGGDSLQAIAKAKAEIERRAAERYAQEQEEFEKKVADRKTKVQKNGKKARCRQPKPPEPDPKDKGQVNLTDEESRRIKGTTFGRGCP
jgi:hypothetical protein